MQQKYINLSLAWQITFAVMLCVLVSVIPDLALAGNPNGKDTPMGNVMCIVFDWFSGNAGKGLATLSISIIGVSALLGKVSWGMSIVSGIGVAIIFGADGILDALETGAEFQDCEIV